MKTYSESKGEEPFNWNEFLNKENITEEEWDNAESLADSWVTCACGNQCDVIPRDYFGEPKDWELFKLGNNFAKAIESKNINSAKEILKDIEERSAYLINEITNN